MATRLPEQHGGGGHQSQHRNPAAHEVRECGGAFRAGEADCHNLEEDEEAGDLGAGRDERGAGRGRSLVDIRRPEVEWRGGDLEAEADRGGDDGDGEERVESGAVNRGGDAREAGGVGEAVEQAEAEEQEGRGHSAEEVVLHGGFPGLQAALVEGGEGVEREAQEFQRDEDDQQVLRCDEEHHAGSCEQDEQDELADVYR